MRCRVFLKVFAIVFIVLLALPAVGRASVVATGDVHFDFSSFPTTPVPYFYGWGGNYYGYVAYYNTDNFVWTYPWSPNGQAFLDGTTYIGTETDGSSSISGQWSPTTGAGSAGLTAVDNHSDARETYVNVGIGNPFNFLGPYETLPDFSYHYDFAASKTELADAFYYAVQLQLGYVYYDAAGKYHEQRMYSDYADYGYGFRTNWVYEYSDPGQAIMDAASAGQKDFSGFKTLDGEAHQWFIEYGFGISGQVRLPVDADDDESPNSIVPEPCSLALLGLGLSGLLFRRKRNA